MFDDRNENFERQVETVLRSFKRSLETIESGSTELIEMLEWRAFRKSEAWVEFGGLGPCLGVFVHLEQSRITLGCHFPQPEEQNSDDFADFLSCLKKSGLSQKKVQIYLAGFQAVPETDRDRTVINAFQEKTISYFLDLGVGRNCIHEHWADDENGIDITLHIGTGEVSVETQDEWG